MIQGMNPTSLRAVRDWHVYLWPQKRHWSLVLSPAGDIFTARLVDDFLHHAQECCSLEVPSSQLFLVFELLVDGHDPYLTLSVKPDFAPDASQVQKLGMVGPMDSAEVMRRATAVVRRYRGYSLVGCNCQHFVSDFATRLGSRTRIPTEDEVLVEGASDSAATVGLTLATIAATVSAANSGGSTSVAAAHVCTSIVGTAGMSGLLGGAALLSVAAGYRQIHDSFRDQSDPLARRRLLRRRSSQGSSILEE
jgi:hypothetical protein